METSQIDAFGKRLYKKKWLGCFAQNEPYRLRCKELTNKIRNEHTKNEYGQMLIINTDDLKMSGEHWVLVCFVNTDEVFIYDSFGSFSVREMLNEGDKKFDKIIPTKIKIAESNWKIETIVFDNSTPPADDDNLLTFLKKCLYRPPQSQNNFKITYIANQTQPYNTYVCGELSLYIASLIYEYFLDKKYWMVWKFLKNYMKKKSKLKTRPSIRNVAKAQQFIRILGTKEMQPKKENIELLKKNYLF